MISQPLTVMRINKMGKPYVQSEDPSIHNTMTENDVWINPSTGQMKMWNGSSWDEMQWGGSAIMDDCIANRMLANDISASKIVTGILKSQDDSFYLNLETGEAELLNLVLGGQVEGNIIATSSNGLTRVRLRGREGTRDVTAGLIFEQRESLDTDEWQNAGQIYFAYSTQRTYATFQGYEIGPYNSNRPIMGYNAGTSDGLMWRMISQDWLNACYYTFHGARIAHRDDTDDSFENINPVITIVGNVMEGTSVVGNGIVTCTYKFNDVMQLDFNIKITTSGSGTGEYGLSVNTLRTLSEEVPNLVPKDGGTLSIYNSSGSLVTSYVGATFKANDLTWQPAFISSGSITTINESSITNGMTIIGTCYAKYSL